MDPRGGSRDQIAVIAVAAPPFDHARGKDAFGLPGGIGPDLVEKPVERLSRPEAPVEHACLAARAAIGDELLYDDRP